MSIRRVCRGPTRVGACLFIASVAVGGCGDDEPMGGNAPGGGNTGGSGAEAPGGGPQGGAGGGNTGGGGGGPMLEEFNAVAQGLTPFDATPNQDGTVVYFTGVDPEEGAGVFSVDSAGGTVAQVSTGDPFVAPFGIAVANTPGFAYVTDPAADEAGGDRGKIFSVNVGNGQTTDVVTGFSPLGLDISDARGEDTIYFSGRNASGEPGVFSVLTGGGSVTEVFAGGSLVDPSGIAVSTAGDIYFVDTVGSGSRNGRIYVLEGGAGSPSLLADEISVGYPAGLAITADDSELWVSAIEPTTRTDVLLRVNTGTGAVTSYVGDSDTSIAELEEAAGIHRAKNADIFAFVDSRAGGDGTVFVLNP